MTEPRIRWVDISRDGSGRLSLREYPDCEPAYCLSFEMGVFSTVNHNDDLTEAQALLLIAAINAELDEQRSSRGR